MTADRRKKRQSVTTTGNEAARSMCAWSENDDGFYETTCANAFQFTNSGPKANGFRFCPYCGGSIITAQPKIRRTAGG